MVRRIPGIRARVRRSLVDYFGKGYRDYEITFPTTP